MRKGNSRKALLRLGDSIKNNLEDFITSQKEFPVWQLSDRLDDICINFYKELLWSLGGKELVMDEQFSVNMLAKMKKEKGIS
jgi:hypothetical protein